MWRILILILALPLAAAGCADPVAPEGPPEPEAASTGQARPDAPAPGPVPQAMAGTAVPPLRAPFRDPNPLVPRVRTPAALPPGGDGGRAAEAIGALESRVDLLSERGWPYDDLLPIGVDPHP